MPSVINSDDGVSSGSSGLKTTGGNDGILALQNNGTTNVTVTAAGRVGVGTTSPVALLDANGVSLFRDVMYSYQPSPTSLAVSTTLSVAQLLTGILQVTAPAVVITMPTGTTLDSGLLASLPTNGSVDFSVVHTGGGSPPSIAANTGVTIVGNANIGSGGSSGLFRLRKTGTATYVVYRLT